jgi:hypothetical protein
METRDLEDEIKNFGVKSLAFVFPDMMFVSVSSN